MLLSTTETCNNGGCHVDLYCLDNSLGTDTPAKNKQLLSTEGRDQGQASQPVSPHPNSSQVPQNDCKGPWPGFPECAEKMEVTRPLCC